MLHPVPVITVPCIFYFSLQMVKLDALSDMLVVESTNEVENTLKVEEILMDRLHT